jgi:hypothetical protein
MNRIVIIGNGFDLAHGLETSYEEFLLHYFKQVIKKSREHPNKIYFDKLIHIECSTNVPIENEIKTIEDIFNNPNISFTRKNHPYYIKYKSSFFENLIQSKKNRWTDIENYYFQFLAQQFNLRKNETDSSIQLKNIRGIGYKLIVEV